MKEGERGLEGRIKEGRRRVMGDKCRTEDGEGERKENGGREMQNGRMNKRKKNEEEVQER